MLLADFINMLTWWQWGLLGLIPPAIIALYFLKLRRQPLSVPSTYLWSRAIEDLHVNSLWQRLRQSLLLFLQLLLIGLLAFTLLRPGWKGTELIGKRFIFLIDTSASMGATDTAPSRLDDAKRQVKALIEQMKPENAAMVISFSDIAKVEQPFTNSRRLLRQRVELISKTNRPSDLSEALRAASGLANPGQSDFEASDVQTAEALPATLYIFSDGGVGPVPKFKLGNLEPVYVKMGEEAQQNVAIASFSTDVNPEKPGQIQAFARIENYAEAETSVEASLFLNDTLLDAQKITLPPRGEKGLPGASGARFEMNNTIESGVLKLVLDTKDALGADNTAFAVVNLPRPAKVLVVSPGNDALELALGTDEAKKIADVSFAEPKLLETKAYADQAAEGAFDLVIYDQCAPKTMPNCNTLFIARLPPTDWAAKGPRQGPPLVIDTDQVHPLTQLVQMGNVKIVEATPLTGPQGTITLIDADIGPIYAIGPRAGYEDAVLGFELVTYTPEGKREVNTDWPIRRSFPVFVMNAVKYLGGVRSSLAAPSIKPGQPAILRTTIPVDSVVVESPRKERFNVPKEASNTYIFGRTEDLGVYDVREGSGQKVNQQFAVNLFDPRESDLKPKDVVLLGAEEVKGQTAKNQSRQELWKWLLLAAIGVLIFEWYIYNRRVYL
ncbi:MAG: BatA and WFA domain-containing protein [Planctomycetaceae bacterium]|nr:BatA and WFA domain-containing protein [Planctomycetaceae bacterium]